MDFETSNVISQGVLASLLAGLSTGIGSLGVFLVRRLSEAFEDGMLSLAAGIMLAATFFSLLLPSIEYSQTQFESVIVAISIVIAGFLSGAGILFLIHRFLPHEHFMMGVEGPDANALSRIWLFTTAIALHNFPEGMAVGVGFAGGDVSNGVSLALGIAIQNIPEGMVVSLSLLSVGYSKTNSFLVGFLTGLAEPLGGLFGSVAVSMAQPMMPFSLAFAAGAMLFIISDEIIPETHSRGFQNLATFSLLIGFAFMMFINAMFN